MPSMFHRTLMQRCSLGGEKSLSWWKKFEKFGILFPLLLQNHKYVRILIVNISLFSKDSEKSYGQNSVSLKNKFFFKLKWLLILMLCSISQSVVHVSYTFVLPRIRANSANFRALPNLRWIGSNLWGRAWKSSHLTSSPRNSVYIQSWKNAWHLSVLHPHFHVLSCDCCGELSESITSL